MASARTGIPLGRHLLTICLAISCFLGGYNANGDSEWTTKLDMVAAIRGNEFGMPETTFQKGHARVVVQVPNYSNRLVIFVPCYLTPRRLYVGSDDQLIMNIELAATLNKLTGVSVQEVFEYEIQLNLDASYEKGQLIRESVLRVFAYLHDKHN